MNCAAMKKANAPAVWWQGNDGFLFSDGTRLIATDLDLFNPERKWAPTVDLEELCEALDWLFITHGHEDHYNTATVEYLFKNGAAVLPFRKAVWRKHLRQKAWQSVRCSYRRTTAFRRTEFPFRVFVRYMDTLEARYTAGRPCLTVDIAFI